MALAIAVGLMLGVALAIGIEWTSDTVHDVEEVESATELVCLATFGNERRRPRAVGRRGVA
jgi:capsular polysaccharide biosynthesis protein